MLGRGAAEGGAALTLQSFLGTGQLLLLLCQLHLQLGGREHLGGLAAVCLLQVLGQHFLHLPEQVDLLLQLGHLLPQQRWRKRRHNARK